MTVWTWSYSASQQLQACPRAFSFGLAQRRDSPSATAEQFSARSLAGSAVHHAIAFAEYSRGDGRPVREQELSDVASRFVENAIQRGLIEERNGARVTRSTLERIRTRTRADVLLFARNLWPKIAPNEYVGHEIDDVVETQGHSIRVRVDYACRSHSGDVLLVEWKTTRELDVREGGYQLAVYALWAHEKLRVPVAKIRPVLADIFSAELNSFQATAQDLDYVLDWVSGDEATVARFESAGHFPANPEPRKCAACRFAYRCPEGQTAIAESGP